MLTTILAIHFACLLWLVIMLHRAPLGWQDAQGFHFGREGER